MHSCPNCGKEFQKNSIEICPDCGFNFNTTLSCPYKISNKCVFNNTRDCLINGLDYETCKLYLHKSGITK